MKILFQAKLAKKGDQRIIWIPVRFHDKLVDLAKTQYKIIIKNKKTKIRFVAMILKTGENRIIKIPSFLTKEAKKISSDKSSIMIEKF